MNIPYRKETNLIGEITNPITKGNPYINPHPNRATRKARPKRFRGNGKGVSLTVIGSGAYHRVAQYIPNHYDFDLYKSKVVLKQKARIITHYIPKQPKTT